MFPQRHTKQLFSAAIITNLILVVGLVGLYYFLHDRAAAANRLSREVEKVQSKQERERSLDDLIADTVEDRDMLDEFFVGPGAAAEFITTIEDLAAETNVTMEIGNVSITAPETTTDTETEEGAEESASNPYAEAGDTFENLELQLQATGRWDRVIHFVRVLELLPQETVITNISLEQSSQAGPNDSTPPWNAVLTIVARKLSGQ